MKTAPPGTLVISHFEPGDLTFESDQGSWNVTRAIADCGAGKHELYAFDVADVFEANKAIDVDESKIAAMVALADLSDLPPLIFAMERGFTWLIDGHHRIHALHRRRVVDCAGYVIEESDGQRYRIYYNGARVAPWRIA
jgi:hypothetical protein